MTKGYGNKKIQEKLIGILQEQKTGLTGLELAEKLKINRATMSKYLKILAAEGLLKQKQIGSVNLWFVEEGVDQLRFPADFFQVRNKYSEYVLSLSANQANNLIKTSLHSGAKPSKLIAEVIVPTIESIENSYASGKIGKSEKNFLDVMMSNSIYLIEAANEEVDLKKNIVIIATDSQNYLLAKAASAAFHSEKWKTFLLGDMSSAIDVMFDIDLQRFLSKIWSKREGVLIVAIFSSKEEEIKFFRRAIDSSKAKFGKNFRVVLCTKIAKKTKTDADFISDDLEKLLQWSQTTFESSQS